MGKGGLKLLKKPSYDIRTLPYRINKAVTSRQAEVKELAQPLDKEYIRDKIPIGISKGVDRKISRGRPTEKTSPKNSSIKGVLNPNFPPVSVELNKK